MATKTTETTEAAPEQTSDGPLLDLTDAAVKRMIKAARKRGWVTYDELNAVLPPDEFSSEQIEDVLGQLSEMGINVVESDEAEGEGQAEDGEGDEEGPHGVSDGWGPHAARCTRPHGGPHGPGSNGSVSDG